MSFKQIQEVYIMIKKIALIFSALLLASATFSEENNTLVPATKPVAPNYPTPALDRKHTGWTVLEYTINENGRAEEIKVTDSEPTRVFDRASIRALRQSHFEITEVDGSAIKVEKQVIKYVFELNEDIPGVLASK